MKKVILVGACKHCDFSFLKQREKDTYYVACDGGYEAYLSKGFEPDFFIGDFDTLDPDKIGQIEKLIKLNVIKDDTDTFMAIKECLKEGYREFHLYGCLGGKIDHTIANLQLLYFLFEQGAYGYLYDQENKTVVFLLTSHQKVTFNKESKGLFSVFSYLPESHGVSEKNFKYELNHITLRNDTSLGLSNQFIEGKEGYISLEEGALLITVPLNTIKEINRN